jgi:hypothetical protein
LMLRVPENKPALLKVSVIDHSIGGIHE